jgi:hypothetical protein
MRSSRMDICQSLARLALGAGLTLAIGASAHAYRGGGGDVYVRGYTRANGTYVQPYYQSAHDGVFGNNFSTAGNINPYTGAWGTRYLPSTGSTAQWGTMPYYSPMHAGPMASLPDPQLRFILLDPSSSAPPPAPQRYYFLNNTDYDITEITYRADCYLKGKLVRSGVFSATFPVASGDWRVLTLTPKDRTELDDVKTTILSAKGIHISP